MQIARVVGTVVATQKNRKLEGAKLLLVQPLTLDEQPKGPALLAIDSVGAGVGEKVLLVIEGKAAGDALGKKAAAVDAAIIGIIDAVEITACTRTRSARSSATRSRAWTDAPRRRVRPIRRRSCTSPVIRATTSTAWRPPTTAA